MNQSTFDKPEPVAKQAARYVAITHSGNIGAADEAELRRWLAVAPEHEQEYREMLAVWDSLAGLSADPLAQGLPLARRRVGYRWAVAACLLVALALGLYQYSAQRINWLPPDNAQLYTTRIGEQKTVNLADGSRIMLNTDSQVRLHDGPRQRLAELLYGEAFFIVAKNRDHPFEVKLGSQKLTVLGTQFNIRKQGAEYRVAVTEGVVALHHEKEPVRVSRQPYDVEDSPGVTRIHDQYQLKAGAVITFEDRATVLAVANNTAGRGFYAWYTGQVTFTETPLSEVVQEINRYTPRKILIADARVMTMKVGGVFDLKNVEQTLFGLEALFPLDIVYDNNRIVIRQKADSGR